MRRQVLPIRGSGYPSRREMGAESQRAQGRTTTCAARASRATSDGSRPETTRLKGTAKRASTAWRHRQIA